MIEVTYTAWDGTTMTDGVATASTPEEVEQLVALLTAQKVNDAVAVHLERAALPSGYPDHELAFGFRGERGALRYDGDDDGDGGGTWYSVGNGPNETAEYVQGTFPPRCEITHEAVSGALREFLATKRRPTSVQWQEA